MKIGIDIGGSHISTGLINEKLDLIDKIEYVFSITEKLNLQKIVVEKIKEHIEVILERNNLKLADISFIGIACPGTIQNGYIQKADNMKIYNFNIVEELNKFFNLKVKIRNDAKCAALAEKHIGSLKNYQDCVFITLGTGIGGAVFLKNQLLETSRYSAFEIGHMIIQKNGKQCSCGKKGCFETYASMQQLKQTIRQQYGLTQQVHSEELMKILDNKTEMSNEILAEYIENLCIGLSTLIDLFEPEAISIGGSFAYYKNIFLPKIKEKMQDKINTFNGRTDIEILVATLKNDAGIIGSVIEQ